MPEYLFSKSDFHIKFMKQIMACRNPKATEAQTTVIFKLECCNFLKVLDYL